MTEQDDGGRMSQAEMGRTLRRLEKAWERDVEEIKAQIAGLGSTFVRHDVYEAKHAALRQHVNAEVATLRTEVAGNTSASQAARAIGMWAIGLICAIVIGAVVTFVITGARPS